MKRSSAFTTTLLLLSLACTPSEPVGADGTSTDETGESGDTGEDWPMAESELPRDENPDASMTELSTLADDQQALALDIYKALLGDPSFADKSLAISATSIASAFGMLYGGSVGQAKTEIESTLHFSLMDERQHVAHNWLDLELEKRNLEGSEDPDYPVDPVVLALANGVWLDQTLGDDVLPDYLDLLAVHYGTGIRLADFTTSESAEAERVAINAWVSARTNELIPELFKPSHIVAGVKMVLVNALYLKAPWAEVFEEAMTSTANFTLLDGGSKSVELMHDEALYGYYGEDTDYAAMGVGLRGGALELVFVLPTGELPSFEASLDQPKLASTLDGMQVDLVDTFIPRFTVTTDLLLNGVLTDLGMPTPFGDPDSFLGVAPQGVGMISAVVHSTVLSVDEGGVEAAAATGIVTDEGGDGEELPDLVFRADRPFMVMIYDRPTRTVLFLGRVVDP